MKETKDKHNQEVKALKGFEQQCTDLKEDLQSKEDLINEMEQHIQTLQDQIDQGPATGLEEQIAALEQQVQQLEEDKLQLESQHQTEINEMTELCMQELAEKDALIEQLQQ